ncbi:MAG TPA: hypothetical protein VHC23_10985 [Jatrophihabitans sp.]|nr:hypothetical protein [Jatrophihabitans sp.]
MAVIHHTTLVPSKLELLAGWLPTRDWFDSPVDGLERAGGFRLDDPAGEVGVELMIVRAADGAAYFVPMAYRDAPADGSLVGTTEHGVLGRRWVYDGEHDPVLQAQLAALVRGEAAAQAQSESNTPDPTVLVGTAAGCTAVRLRRRLTKDEAAPGVGDVSATWLRADGSRARGVVATAG